MSITRVDQIFALFLILFGFYLIWSGLDYGYMSGTTPGAGFFPVLIGGAISVLSAFNLYRALAGKEKLSDGVAGRDIVKIALICIALAAVVLVAPFIGLTLSVMAFMLVSGFIIRPSLAPGFLLKLIPVSILFPLFLRLAFGVWLRIPVPTGPFGL